MFYTSTLVYEAAYVKLIKIYRFDTHTAEELGCDTKHVEFSLNLGICNCTKRRSEF